MSKLLSIAIPTYNRAQMLDTQLLWLSENLAGIESDCNIFISDNCSTDDTSEVIAKWSQKFHDLGIEFNSNRHASNIGGMANIEATMLSGTGDYVWTLGDDDKIKDGTATYIIELLRKNIDLSMLLLDGVGVDQLTGEIKYDCLFKSGTEKPFNGPSGFGYFLDHTISGIFCISSAIYSSRLAQQCCKEWPESHKNFAAQIYWVAYCAARGNFVITPSQHTEVAMGIGFSDKDVRMGFRLQYRGLPEVFMVLMKSGYSRALCLRKVYSNLYHLGAYKVLFGGLRRWFPFAFSAYMKYLTVVVKAPFVALSIGSLRNRSVLE